MVQNPPAPGQDAESPKPITPQPVEPRLTAPLRIITQPSERGIKFALLALSIGGFGIGTTEFASMGLLPYIADGFSTSLPSAGLGITLYALGVVVGAPLITGMAARVERKTLLLSLIGAFAIGNLLTAVAPTQGTFLAARFLTGLPHGAYFGVAAVVAASLVKRDRRARAIARVMLGLTVANIIGVPLVTLLAQHVGWRGSYVVTAAIGLVALVAIIAWVPMTYRDLGASLGRELGALRRPQVLLAVAIGAIGFGGVFSVYAYISPIMTDVANFPLSFVPWVLAAFGVGMTVGTVAAGPIVDRSVRAAILVGILLLGVLLAVFALVASSAAAAIVTLFAIGVVGSVMTTGLQVRLMDVSRDVPSLAASLNHSAFNLANANGAFLGGLVITSGFGLLASAWVGVGLAGIGLALAVFAFWLERRNAAAPVVAAKATVDV